MTSINAHVYAAAVSEIKDVKGKVISKGNKKDRLNFKSLSEKYHVAINAIRGGSDLPKMSAKDKFLEFFGLKCAFIHINNEAGKKIWLKINVNSLIKRFGIEKHEINAILKHSADRNITFYLNAKIQGLLPPKEIEIEPAEKAFDEILKKWKDTDQQILENQDVKNEAQEQLRREALFEQFEILKNIAKGKANLTNELALKFFREVNISKGNLWFFKSNGEERNGLLGEIFYNENRKLWDEFMGQEPEAQPEPVSQAIPKVVPAANHNEIEVEIEVEKEIEKESGTVEPKPVTINEILALWDHYAVRYFLRSDDEVGKARETEQIELLKRIFLSGEVPFVIGLQFLQVRSLKNKSKWFFDANGEKTDLGKEFAEKHPPLWAEFMKIQPAPAPQAAPAKKAPLTYQNIVDNSDAFYRSLGALQYELPKGNRIAELHELALDKAAFEKEIEKYAKHTVIVLDKKLLEDIVEFLKNKKQNGNGIEKDVYETMTPFQFIQRLITKRPLTFYAWGDDDFMLRPEHRCVEGIDSDDELAIVNGQGNKLRLFERIGTDYEAVVHDPSQKKTQIIPYVTLKNYLSYEEMELSQRLLIVGKSHLIGENFEKNAIFIGGEGCRFKRNGQMQAKPPYWKMKLDPEDCVDDYQFIRFLNQEGYFNKILYKQRMKEIYHSILTTVNEFGSVVVQMFPLGSWDEVGELQRELTIEVIKEILKENPFNQIIAINLGLIAKKVERPEYIGGIPLFYLKNHPPGKKLGKVAYMDLTGIKQVIVHNLDCNSYVGNHYWKGHRIGGTIYSTIGELQNPDINPGFLNNISITGVKDDEVEKYNNLLMGN